MTEKASINTEIGYYLGIVGNHPSSSLFSGFSIVIAVRVSILGQYILFVVGSDNSIGHCALDSVVIGVWFPRVWLLLSMFTCVYPQSY